MIPKTLLFNSAENSIPAHASWHSYKPTHMHANLVHYSTCTRIRINNIAKWHWHCISTSSFSLNEWINSWIPGAFCPDTYLIETKFNQSPFFWISQNLFLDKFLQEPLYKSYMSNYPHIINPSLLGTMIRRKVLMNKRKGPWTAW